MLARQFLAAGVAVEVDTEGGQKEKKKNPNAQIFVERSIKDRNVSWKRISRNQFALSSDPVLCGTEEELRDEISRYEGLPSGSATSDHWNDKSFYLLCSDLEPALDWTKRNSGVHLRLGYSCFRETKDIVRVRPGYGYVIRKEWSTDGSDIIHDPIASQKRLEAHERWVTEHPDHDKPKQKAPTCQIPCTDVLCPISQHLEQLTDKRILAGLKVSEKNRWSAGRVIRTLSAPFKRASLIWMIPYQARLADMLGVDYRHRTQKSHKWDPVKKKQITYRLTWRRMIQILSSYLKDPGVTSDLRKFIWKELKLLKMEPYDRTAEDRAKRLRDRESRRQEMLRREACDRQQIHVARTFRASGD